MIYLDHNATSPLLDEVLDAMRPWFGVPANPASAHRAGQAAAVAVEAAREHVAALVGGDPRGVVFTSGATEANHLALRGAWGLRPGAVVVGALEHPCVLAAADVLARQGARVARWPAGRDGVVVPAPLSADVTVVALQAANHETGVIQPIHTAHALAREVGAFFHVDATQAAGRVALDLARVDGVALSAHKLGGPGGVGALVLRDGEPFPPLLSGGAQERGRRAGTVNTAGVVGFGEACRLALTRLDARAVRLTTLSERLRAALITLGAQLVGDPAHLLPNTTTVVFPGQSGEEWVQRLDLHGVCVSSGAACASGSLEASPVLSAMGHPEPAGALRFSLGPQTTEAELDAAIRAVTALV